MSNRGLVITLVMLVAVVLLVPAVGMGVMGPGLMGPGMMGGFGRTGAFGGPGWVWGLGMGLGGLAMLAFWAAVIIGIILLVRALSGEHHRTAGGESPLDILKRRYAAGEINREQYDEMRRTLDS
jgi:putative membrane protein